MRKIILLFLFVALPAFGSGVFQPSNYNPTSVTISGGTIGSVPVANLKPNFPLTVTGTDTLTAPLPAGAALTDMQGFVFESNAANTGAMTLNIGGLGAKALLRKGGGAMVAGDVPAADYVMQIFYDASTDTFHTIMEGGSNTAPVMDGSATIGTLQRWARADHVHPSDTSRALLAGSSSQSFSTATLSTQNYIYVNGTNPYIILNGNTGAIDQIYYYDNNVPKWGMGKDASHNFFLHNNTTSNDTFTVNAASNATVFAGNITAANCCITYTTQTTPFPGAGVSINQSHGLGTANFSAVLELINITAECDYSPGEIVQWSGKVSDGSTVSEIWKNTNNVGAINATGGSNWLIRARTSASNCIPTPAKWAYRFALTR